MTRLSPSLAPDFNSDTYLVVDELQTGYSVYREADEVEATRGEVIRQITEGQFNKAVRVIAFNTAEGLGRRRHRRHCERYYAPRAAEGGAVVSTSARICRTHPKTRCAGPHFCRILGAERAELRYVASWPSPFGRGSTWSILYGQTKSDSGTDFVFIFWGLAG